MSIFGHANDAPMYKPAPWAKPLTHQVDKMKDNWVKQKEDEIHFLYMSISFMIGFILTLTIIVFVHIFSYGRI